MIRGTFANIRLRNQLVAGVEGGFTVNFLDGEQATIYDASKAYQAAGVPLVVLGGKEYGSGSSRDWAAKGTSLLGVRAVITESFERIHRSNLIGMGVLPLQYPAGQNAESLGLDGTETFDLAGITELNDGSTPSTVQVTATKTDGVAIEFDAGVESHRNGQSRSGASPRRPQHHRGRCGRPRRARPEPPGRGGPEELTLRPRPDAPLRLVTTPSPAPQPLWTTARQVSVSRRTKPTRSSGSDCLPAQRVALRTRSSQPCYHDLPETLNRIGRGLRNPDSYQFGTLPD